MWVCRAVLVQLRFRTALLVQAVCVVLAMSNATTVCANCCSSFMSPTFCFFKALTTQASWLPAQCSMHSYFCGRTVTLAG